MGDPGIERFHTGLFPRNDSVRRIRISLGRSGAFVRSIQVKN